MHLPPPPLLPPSSPPPLISQELFYLLADTEQVEQGGVVTVSSLAVELQAGESLLIIIARLSCEWKLILSSLPLRM